MADDLARISPGDPIGKMFRSGTWNRIMEAVRYVESFKSSGGALPGGSIDNGIRHVQNDSGVDVARGSVLGVSGFLYAPGDNLNAFLTRPVFTGVTPTSADYTGNFCVTLEPIASGKQGRAVFFGLAQVQVDFTTGAEEFADVTDGDNTHLTAGASGAARIVAKAAGTGTQWATVRIGAGGSGDGGEASLLTVTADDDFDASNDPVAVHVIDYGPEDVDPDPEDAGINVSNELGFYGDQGSVWFAELIHRNPTEYRLYQSTCQEESEYY